MVKYIPLINLIWVIGLTYSAIKAWFATYAMLSILSAFWCLLVLVFIGFCFYAKKTKTILQASWLIFIASFMLVFNVNATTLVYALVSKEYWMFSIVTLCTLFGLLFSLEKNSYYKQLNEKKTSFDLVKLFKDALPKVVLLIGGFLVFISYFYGMFLIFPLILDVSQKVFVGCQGIYYVTILYVCLNLSFLGAILLLLRSRIKNIYTSFFDGFLNRLGEMIIGLDRLCLVFKNFPQAKQDLLVVSLAFLSLPQMLVPVLASIAYLSIVMQDGLSICLYLNVILYFTYLVSMPSIRHTLMTRYNTEIFIDLGWNTVNKNSVMGGLVVATSVFSYVLGRSCGNVVEDKVQHHVGIHKAGLDNVKALQEITYAENQRIFSAKERVRGNFEIADFEKTQKALRTEQDLKAQRLKI